MANRPCQRVYHVVWSLSEEKSRWLPPAKLKFRIFDNLDGAGASNQQALQTSVEHTPPAGPTVHNSNSRDVYCIPSIQPGTSDLTPAVSANLLAKLKWIDFDDQISISPGDDEGDTDDAAINITAAEASFDTRSITDDDSYLWLQEDV